MKKGLIILISVAATALVMGGVFYYLNSKDKVDNDSNYGNSSYQIENVEKAIALTNLFDSDYVSYSSDDNEFGYVYKNDKTLISDISYEYVLSIIFENLIVFSIEGDENYYTKESDGTLSFDKSLIDKYISDYFGPDYKIDTTKLSSDTAKYLSYNSSTGKYSYRTALGRGGCNKELIKKGSNSFKVYSDGFTISTKVAFFRDCECSTGPQLCSVYKSLNNNDPIILNNTDHFASISSLNIDNKLNTYVYTFKIKENDDFYLYSIELEK